MIDTHTHIYLPEFDNDRDAVLLRAQQEGVTQVLLPNIDLDSVESMHSCVASNKSFCKAMIGLHPCSVKDDYKIVLEKLKQYLNPESNPYCAIGEIGLDYYWDKNFIREQQDALHTQLQWASDYNLPFSMHTRDAMDDAIAITADFMKQRVRGVFHCFGGTIEQAEKIITLNCMLGIGGVVTYKKAALDEVLKFIPLSNIVLETDAPYLTPVPFRGKRNEPAYLKYIVQQLAGIYHLSEAAVIQQTSDNAKRIFQLS